MLTVVCWKWNVGLHPKKRMIFGPDHVHVLASMIKRHLHIPYRMVCVTDDPSGIDKSIEVIPLWTDFLYKGGCFVRLKAFSKDMISVFGPRYCSIDLDCVITGDITPILGCTDEFKIWGESTRKTPYCGSLWISNTGARSQVWERFDPMKYLPEYDNKFRRGTDQAVISDMLYPHEPTWGREDGIYNYGQDIKKHPEFMRLKMERLKMIRNRVHEIANAALRARTFEMKRIARSTHPISEEDKVQRIKDSERGATRKVMQKFRLRLGKMNEAIKQKKYLEGNDGKLPANARIVFFNGAEDPNNIALQAECPWIAEHYK
jgi:hypothetical protein